MTTTELFGRSFRVTLQDKEFGSFDVPRPLSFSFSVQRDRTITPNNANLLLFNLSEETRQHLEQLSGGFGQGTGKVGTKKLTSAPRPKKPKKGVAAAPTDLDAGVTVRLEAGYADSVGTIFFGVLRKVSSWKQGPDWLTQISGGDSEQSLMTAKISQTFPKNTPLDSVLRALVRALPGVGEGTLNNTMTALRVSGLLAGGAKLPAPLVAHGDVATVLTQFLRSCGMTWSVQDGAFEAGLAGVPTFPEAGILLTPDSGLLDQPQIDKRGKVTGKCLLQPDLLPGRVIRIQSSRVTGNFLVEKTEHRGDTNGGDWICQFVAAPPAPSSAAARQAARLQDTGF